MARRAYFIPGLTFIRGFLDSGGLLTAPYNGQPNITAGKSSCNFGWTNVIPGIKYDLWAVVILMLIIS